MLRSRSVFLSKTKSLNFSIEVFITLKKKKICLSPPDPTSSLPHCRDSVMSDTHAERCWSACLTEFLAQLFIDTGYEEVVNEYVFRETVNKKEGLCVPRVFLQSKFRKSPKNTTHVTRSLGHKSWPFMRWTVCTSPWRGRFQNHSFYFVYFYI